jgi:hypothetical protein
MIAGDSAAMPGWLALEFIAQDGAGCKTDWSNPINKLKKGGVGCQLMEMGFSRGQVVQAYVACIFFFPSFL